MLNETVSVWGTERKPWTGYCEITSTRRREKKEKEEKKIGEDLWDEYRGSDGTFDRWNYAWMGIDLRRGSQTASFVILAPITGATSSAYCKSLSFPATRARWSFYTSGVIVEEQRAWLLLFTSCMKESVQNLPFHAKPEAILIGEGRYSIIPCIYFFPTGKKVWERNFPRVTKFCEKEEEK